MNIYTWIIAAITLGVVIYSIHYIIRSKLMVGLLFNPSIASEINQSSNSDVLENWVIYLNGELSVEEALNIPSVMAETGKRQKIVPFAEPLGKLEEIQIRIEEIRKLWREGYNVQTKQTSAIEPLIDALVKLESFVEDYWDYFRSEEKIRLTTQANLLLWYLDATTKLTVRKWLKILFSPKGTTLIKLYWKYRKNISNNPKNHIFIQLRNANLMVAELILDKIKEDLEKRQIFNYLENNNKVNSKMTFDEILKPARNSVKDSGITEDELAKIFEEARDEVWQEWQKEKKV